MNAKVGMDNTGREGLLVDMEQELRGMKMVKGGQTSVRQMSWQLVEHCFPKRSVTRGHRGLPTVVL